MAGPKAVTQYEAVVTKMDDGLTVGEATKAVAQELGVTPGTVTTNYYRVRNEENGRPKRTSISSRSATGETTSEELLRQAVDALTALAHRAEAQEKDLERLRRIERALSDT